MKACEVYLSKLVTYEEHADAITSIEGDPRNSNGDWFSGGPTELKKHAARKIQTIYNRINKKFNSESENK